jgi:2-C-methyl-D-erythritol 2,4-cyclodiphosphate synthase
MPPMAFMLSRCDCSGKVLALDPRKHATRAAPLAKPELAMRVGLGHDTHCLTEGRPLILGGVRIDHPRGLAGHSDADVVLHAVTDALLGAAGLGDIGDSYPDSDPEFHEVDSSYFLLDTLARVNRSGWRIVNLDVIIFAEEPKLGSLKQKIRENLARLLTLDVDVINIKAKTGERVGHIGRKEAIACQAVVLLDMTAKV